MCSKLAQVNPCDRSPDDMAKKLAPMQPRKIFTPAVVSQIAIWLHQVLTSADIAERIGCTLGTLRVRCSQLGISLRGGRAPRRAAMRRHRAADITLSELPATESLPDSPNHLVVAIPRVTLDHLRTRAQSKGISDAILAATLLEKIVEDDLYEAVLDDSR